MLKVHVNRRIGYWQNENMECDICGKLGSLAKIEQCHSLHDVYICKPCLTEAIAAIDAAVLADAGQGRNDGFNQGRT